MARLFDLFCYKSSLCFPEPVLRRVRNRLFICYRETFPAPGSRGLPPLYPASCEVRALYLPHSFYQRPLFSAVRAHFAFRSLCFAGCGNSCSSVIGRAFPHPDPGGCRPHTPASSEIWAMYLPHSFYQRPPFCYCNSSLCFPEPVLRRVRDRLFICYRETFPAPGSRGLAPPYPRFF